MTRIHENRTAPNVNHEFGESIEPRYFATFVRIDGREEPMLLTRPQIEVAIERARRERAEVEHCIAGARKQRRANQIQTVMAGVLGAVFVGLTVLLLIAVAT